MVIKNRIEPKPIVSKESKSIVRMGRCLSCQAKAGKAKIKYTINN